MPDELKTTVRDARTGERIPAKPEWLWHAEWTAMIFGSRDAWRRWTMAKIREQERARARR